MTGPSEARIAAALALAEQAESDYRRQELRNLSWPLAERLTAYMATAPKPLRTRAEVDAEIVRSVRECIEKSLLFPRPELKALCDEPTQAGFDADQTERCDCASRHLKVIGEFEAEAKALRNRISHAIWTLRNNSTMAATATGCAVLRILEGKP